MKIKSLPLGIRAASMEGFCVQRHTTYLKRSGYAYCPWCGIRLQIKLHCEHCGYDFMSERAFEIHNKNIAFYRRNSCPIDKSHPVRFEKHRNRMFCTACHEEFAIKGE